MSLSVKKSLATTLVGIFILAFAAAFWAQDQKANVITGPQDLPPVPCRARPRLRAWNAMKRGSSCSSV